MINEIIEINEYLSGRNVSDKRLYRICYMLARYYKQQKYSYKATRDAIFVWAKKYNVYIRYNLNGIIYKAFEEKSVLKDDVIVKVNSKDVEEINKRFDKQNTKLVALALLCYAKAFADSNGAFSVSLAELSNWIGLDRAHVTGRYIKELVDYEYVEKVGSKTRYSWNGVSDKYERSRFYLLVPTYNSGNYVLCDNNIRRLFRELFS